MMRLMMPRFRFHMLFPVVAFLGFPDRGPEDRQTRALEFSTPEEQGMRSELLVEMLRAIDAEGYRVRSVLLARHGKLVLESYAHPYGPSVLHDVKSVSKSVISALVGVALDRGIISSLDQPVSDFLPDIFPGTGDLRKGRINLAHLLTMTSGLDLDENGPAMKEVLGGEEWIRGAFARNLVAEPGTEFSYCTFLTHAMSGILTEASGTDLWTLADSLLFRPAGISRGHWELGSEGYFTGGDKLWMTPRDMMLFGQLFLDRGSSNGVQVVPESWVALSTTNQVGPFTKDGFSGYGFWWWLSEAGSFSARGAFGQVISVFPEQDLVVVFTGADNHAWRELTDRFILPAVVSAAALPPDQVVARRLEEVVAEREAGTWAAADPIPEGATEFLGRRFVFEPNELEFTDLTFTCEAADSCRLHIGASPHPMDLAVGMDGRYRTTEEVKWGMRTDENTYALTGEWMSHRSVAIEIQEVGEPFFFDVRLDFEEDGLTATFLWQPFGMEVALVSRPDPASRDPRVLLPGASSP